MWNQVLRCEVPKGCWLPHKDNLEIEYLLSKVLVDKDVIK